MPSFTCTPSWEPPSLVTRDVELQQQQRHGDSAIMATPTAPGSTPASTTCPDAPSPSPAIFVHCDTSSSSGSNTSGSVCAQPSLHASSASFESISSLNNTHNTTHVGFGGGSLGSSQLYPPRHWRTRSGPRAVSVRSPTEATSSLSLSGSVGGHSGPRPPSQVVPSAQLDPTHGGSLVRATSTMQRQLSSNNHNSNTSSPAGNSNIPSSTLGEKASEPLTDASSLIYIPPPAVLLNTTAIRGKNNNQNDAGCGVSDIMGGTAPSADLLVAAAVRTAAPTDDENAARGNGAFTGTVGGCCGGSGSLHLSQSVSLSSVTSGLTKNSSTAGTVLSNTAPPPVNTTKGDTTFSRGSYGDETRAADSEAPLALSKSGLPLPCTQHIVVKHSMSSCVESSIEKHSGNSLNIQNCDGEGGANAEAGVAAAGLSFDDAGSVRVGRQKGSLALPHLSASAAAAAATKESAWWDSSTSSVPFLDASWYAHFPDHCTDVFRTAATTTSSSNNTVNSNGKQMVPVYGSPEQHEQRQHQRQVDTGEVDNKNNVEGGRMSTSASFSPTTNAPPTSSSTCSTPLSAVAPSCGPSAGVYQQQQQQLSTSTDIHHKSTTTTAFYNSDNFGIVADAESAASNRPTFSVAARAPQQISVPWQADDLRARSHLSSVATTTNNTVRDKEEENEETGDLLRTRRDETCDVHGVAVSPERATVTRLYTAQVSVGKVALDESESRTVSHSPQRRSQGEEHPLVGEEPKDEEERTTREQRHMFVTSAGDEAHQHSNINDSYNDGGAPRATAFPADCTLSVFQPVRTPYAFSSNIFRGSPAVRKSSPSLHEGEEGEGSSLHGRHADRDSVTIASEGDSRYGTTSPTGLERDLPAPRSFGSVSGQQIPSQLPTSHFSDPPSANETAFFVTDTSAAAPADRRATAGAVATAQKTNRESTTEHAEHVSTSANAIACNAEACAASPTGSSPIQQPYVLNMSTLLLPPRTSTTTATSTTGNCSSRGVNGARQQAGRSPHTPHSAREATLMKQLRVALIDARSVQRHLEELQTLLPKQQQQTVVTAPTPTLVKATMTTESTHPGARSSTSREQRTTELYSSYFTGGQQTASASGGATRTTTPRDVHTTRDLDSINNNYNGAIVIYPQEFACVGGRSSNNSTAAGREVGEEPPGGASVTQTESGNMGVCEVGNAKDAAEGPSAATADEEGHSFTNSNNNTATAMTTTATGVGGEVPPTFKVGGLYTASLNGYRQQRLTQLTEQHLCSLWQNTSDAAKSVAGLSVGQCVRAAALEEVPFVRESTLVSFTDTLALLMQTSSQGNYEEGLQCLNGIRTEKQSCSSKQTAVHGAADAALAPPVAIRSSSQAVISSLATAPSLPQSSLFTPNSPLLSNKKGAPTTQPQQRWHHQQSTERWRSQEDLAQITKKSEQRVERERIYPLKASQLTSPQTSSDREERSWQANTLQQSQHAHQYLQQQQFPWQAQQPQRKGREGGGSAGSFFVRASSLDLSASRHAHLSNRSINTSTPYTGDTITSTGDFGGSGAHRRSSATDATTFRSHNSSNTFLVWPSQSESKRSAALHPHYLTSPISRTGYANSSVSFDGTASTSETIVVRNSPTNLMNGMVVGGSLHDMLMLEALASRSACTNGGGGGNKSDGCSGGSSISNVALNSLSGPITGGGNSGGDLSGVDVGGSSNNVGMILSNSSSPTSPICLATINNSSNNSNNLDGNRSRAQRSYMLPSTLLARLRSPLEQEERVRLVDTENASIMFTTNSNNYHDSNVGCVGGDESDSGGRRESADLLLASSNDGSMVIFDGAVSPPAPVSTAATATATSAAEGVTIAAGVSAGSSTSVEEAYISSSSSPVAAGPSKGADVASSCPFVLLHHMPHSQCVRSTVPPPPIPPPPLPPSQQQQSSLWSGQAITLPPRHSPTSSWHWEMSCGNTPASASPWSLPLPSPVPPPPPAAAQRGAAAAAGWATTNCDKNNSSNSSAFPPISSLGSTLLNSIGSSDSAGPGGGNGGSRHSGNFHHNNNSRSVAGANNALSPSSSSSRYGPSSPTSTSLYGCGSCHSFSIASALNALPAQPVKAPFIKVQREEVAADAVPDLDSSASISVARRAAAAAANNSDTAFLKGSGDNSSSRRSDSRNGGSRQPRRTHGSGHQSGSVQALTSSPVLGPSLHRQLDTGAAAASVPATTSESDLKANTLDGGEDHVNDEGECRNNNQNKSTSTSATTTNVSPNTLHATSSLAIVLPVLALSPYGLRVDEEMTALPPMHESTESIVRDLRGDGTTPTSSDAASVVPELTAVNRSRSGSQSGSITSRGMVGTATAAVCDANDPPTGVSTTVTVAGTTTTITTATSTTSYTGTPSEQTLHHNLTSHQQHRNNNSSLNPNGDASLVELEMLAASSASSKETGNTTESTTPVAQNFGASLTSAHSEEAGEGKAEYVYTRPSPRTHHQSSNDADNSNTNHTISGNSSGTAHMRTELRISREPHHSLTSQAQPWLSMSYPSLQGPPDHSVNARIPRDETGERDFRRSSVGGGGRYVSNNHETATTYGDSGISSGLHLIKEIGDDFNEHTWPPPRQRHGDLSFLRENNSFHLLLQQSTSSAGLAPGSSASFSPTPTSGRDSVTRLFMNPLRRISSFAVTLPALSNTSTASSAGEVRSGISAVSDSPQRASRPQDRCHDQIRAAQHQHPHQEQQGSKADDKTLFADKYDDSGTVRSFEVQRTSPYGVEAEKHDADAHPVTQQDLWQLHGTQMQTQLFLPKASDTSAAKSSSSPSMKTPKKREHTMKLHQQTSPNLQAAGTSSTSSTSSPNALGATAASPPDLYPAASPAIIGSGSNVNLGCGVTGPSASSVTSNEGFCESPLPSSRQNCPCAAAVTTAATASSYLPLPKASSNSTLNQDDEDTVTMIIRRSSSEDEEEEGDENERGERTYTEEQNDRADCTPSEESCMSDAPAARRAHRTREVQRELQGHDSPIRSTSVSPPHPRLFSGDCYGEFHHQQQQQQQLRYTDQCSRRQQNFQAVVYAGDEDEGGVCRDFVVPAPTATLTAKATDQQSRNDEECNQVKDPSHPAIWTTSKFRSGFAQSSPLSAQGQLNITSVIAAAVPEGGGESMSSSSEEVVSSTEKDVNAVSVSANLYPSPTNTGEPISFSSQASPMESVNLSSAGQQESAGNFGDGVRPVSSSRTSMNINSSSAMCSPPPPPMMTTVTNRATVSSSGGHGGGNTVGDDLQSLFSISWPPPEAAAFHTTSHTFTDRSLPEVKAAMAGADSPKRPSSLSACGHHHTDAAEAERGGGSCSDAVGVADAFSGYGPERRTAATMTTIIFSPPSKVSHTAAYVDAYLIHDNDNESDEGVQDEVEAAEVEEKLNAAALTEYQYIDGVAEESVGEEVGGGQHGVSVRPKSGSATSSISTQPLDGKVLTSASGRVGTHHQRTLSPAPSLNTQSTTAASNSEDSDDSKDIRAKEADVATSGVVANTVEATTHITNISEKNDSVTRNDQPHQEPTAAATPVLGHPPLNNSNNSDKSRNSATNTSASSSPYPPLRLHSSPAAKLSTNSLNVSSSARSLATTLSQTTGSAALSAAATVSNVPVTKTLSTTLTSAISTNTATTTTSANTVTTDVHSGVGSAESAAAVATATMNAVGAVTVTTPTLHESTASVSAAAVQPPLTVTTPVSSSYAHFNTSPAATTTSAVAATTLSVETPSATVTLSSASVSRLFDRASSQHGLLTPPTRALPILLMPQPPSSPSWSSAHSHHHGRLERRSVAGGAGGGEVESTTSFLGADDIQERDGGQLLCELATANTSVGSTSALEAVPTTVLGRLQPLPLLPPFQNYPFPLPRESSYDRDFEDSEYEEREGEGTDEPESEELYYDDFEEDGSDEDNDDDKSGNSDSDDVVLCVGSASERRVSKRTQIRATELEDPRKAVVSMDSQTVHLREASDYPQRAETSKDDSNTVCSTGKVCKGIQESDGLLSPRAPRQQLTHCTVTPTQSGERETTTGDVALSKTAVTRVLPALTAADVGVRSDDKGNDAKKRHNSVLEENLKGGEEVEEASVTAAAAVVNEDCGSNYDIGDDDEESAFEDRAPTDLSEAPLRDESGVCGDGGTGGADGLIHDEDYDMDGYDDFNTSLEGRHRPCRSSSSTFQTNPNVAIPTLPIITTPRSGSGNNSNVNNVTISNNGDAGWNVSVGGSTAALFSGGWGVGSNHSSPRGVVPRMPSPLLSSRSPRQYCVFPLRPVKVSSSSQNSTQRTYPTNSAAATSDTTTDVLCTRASKSGRHGSGGEAHPPCHRRRRGRRAHTDPSLRRSPGPVAMHGCTPRLHRHKRQQQQRRVRANIRHGNAVSGCSPDHPRFYLRLMTATHEVEDVCSPESSLNTSGDKNKRSGIDNSGRFNRNDNDLAFRSSNIRSHSMSGSNASFDSFSSTITGAYNNNVDDSNSIRGSVGVPRHLHRYHRHHLRQSAGLGRRSATRDVVAVRVSVNEGGSGISNDNRNGINDIGNGVGSNGSGGGNTDPATTSTFRSSLATEVVLSDFSTLGRSRSGHSRESNETPLSMYSADYTVMLSSRPLRSGQLQRLSPPSQVASSGELLWTSTLPLPSATASTICVNHKSHSGINRNGTDENVAASASAVSTVTYAASREEGGMRVIDTTALNNDFLAIPESVPTLLPTGTVPTRSFSLAPTITFSMMNTTAAATPTGTTEAITTNAERAAFVTVANTVSSDQMLQSISVKSSLAPSAESPLPPPPQSSIALTELPLALLSTVRVPALTTEEEKEGGESGGEHGSNRKPVTQSALLTDSSTAGAATTDMGSTEGRSTPKPDANTVLFSKEKTSDEEVPEVDDDDDYIGEATLPEARQEGNKAAAQGEKGTIGESSGVAHAVTGEYAKKGGDNSTDAVRAVAAVVDGRAAAAFHVQSMQPSFAELGPKNPCAVALRFRVSADEDVLLLPQKQQEQQRASTSEEEDPAHVLLKVRKRTEEKVDENKSVGGTTVVPNINASVVGYTSGFPQSPSSQLRQLSWTATLVVGAATPTVAAVRGPGSVVDTPTARARYRVDSEDRATGRVSTYVLDEACQEKANGVIAEGVEKKGNNATNTSDETRRIFADRCADDFEENDDAEEVKNGAEQSAAAANPVRRESASENLRRPQLQKEENERGEVDKGASKLLTLHEDSSLAAAEALLPPASKSARVPQEDARNRQSGNSALVRDGVAESIGHPSQVASKPSVPKTVETEEQEKTKYVLANSDEGEGETMQAPNSGDEKRVVSGARKTAAEGSAGVKQPAVRQISSDAVDGPLTPPISAAASVTAAYTSSSKYHSSFYPTTSTDEITGPNQLVSYEQKSSIESNKGEISAGKDLTTQCNSATAETRPQINSPSPSTHRPLVLPSYYLAQCEDGLCDVANSRTAWHATTSAFFPVAISTSATDVHDRAGGTDAFNYRSSTGGRVPNSGYSSTINGAGSKASSLYAATSATSRRRALVRASYGRAGEMSLSTFATTGTATTSMTGKVDLTSPSSEPNEARRVSAPSVGRVSAGAGVLDSDSRLLALMRHTVDSA